MSIFNPSLAWWQFLILGLIPPLIVLLYFLKLKRHPLEVPSTYLWSRTIEDLHVNTIWQRLRQSLLLFLQILLILLIILTLLQPGWRGTQLEGEHFIFVIDTSASMSATDVDGSRLEEAKKEVEKYLDQMTRGQAAMIITCSDKAQVELSYRTNVNLLKDQLRQIVPSNRRTNLTEALRYSSALANPDRTRLEGSEAGDESTPATLYIIGDGGGEEVKDFVQGKLNLQYHPIGTVDARNVAITSFSTQRVLDRPGKLEVFARLENFHADPTTVNLKLYRDGTFVDAAVAEMEGSGSSGAEFTIDDFQAGILRLEIVDADDLAIDNEAYAVVNTPRKAKVLLVSEGNKPLTFALSTTEAARIADVSIVDPAALDTQTHKDLVNSGQLDLIIYDRCSPKELPQANTFFIGRLPPGEEWKKNNKTGSPAIIDVEATHPLMQLVSTNNILIADGFGIEGPSGKSVLIDSDIGSILTIAPRESFEDVVLGFELVSKNDQGEVDPVTTWHIRRSFPVFMLNVVRYLGGGSGGEGDSVTVQPGDPITLRSSAPVDRLMVTTPSGKELPIARNSQNVFVNTATEEVGIYEVRAGNSQEVEQRFAVNLFDSSESDIPPKEDFEIEVTDVATTTGVKESRKETWKWILILGLIVLVFEWYVYNRRVYF